jgi:tetratricopeptide (TPR) repeat protein
VLSRMGRSVEALEAAEQALGLKPAIVEAHLASVGTAYAVAGRPEQALAPLQRFLSRYLNILQAHLTLAAVYSEWGRKAEARAEAAEVLRLNPHFSLEVYRQREPLKNPAQVRVPTSRPAPGRVAVSGSGRASWCPMTHAALLAHPSSSQPSGVRHVCGWGWTSATGPLMDSDVEVVTQHGWRLLWAVADIGHIHIDRVGRHYHYRNAGDHRS